MSKELTRDEVQDKFLSQVESYVHYWNTLEHKSKEEALKGLAFSIMVILDGGSMNIPALAVIPFPHPSDKEYHMDNDEEYYPDFDNKDEYCDIAGSLHERIFKNRKELL